MKRFLEYLFIIEGILFGVIGVLFFINPFSTLANFINICGVLIILAGIFSIIRAFAFTNNVFLIANGTISILFGLLLCFSPVATKMSLPAQELFFRGLFCNILVCLAVWCTFRCKDDVSKLIMIFWCLFIFITAGFEHSVANMTLLTIGLLSPGTAAVSIAGYIYNIGVVTLGNMIGGIFFVAIPYYLISRKNK